MINNPEFFREAILTIMMRQCFTLYELAEAMGVDSRRIRRYIRRELKGTGTRTAMTHRYPEQYLVERMLEPDDRERLLKQHVWRV